MTNMTATKAQIYSNDGKLYVGMTQKEAHLDDKLLELFTFADVNKDRVLDENEISRYNGPTIHVNSQGDYYPGLKLENVPLYHQKTFRQIDAVPRDGIIQENEINEYVDNHKKSSKKTAINTGIVGGLIGAISFPLLAKILSYKKLGLAKTVGIGLIGAGTWGLFTTAASWIIQKNAVKNITP